MKAAPQLPKEPPAQNNLTHPILRFVNMRLCPFFHVIVHRERASKKITICATTASQENGHVVPIVQLYTPTIGGNGNQSTPFTDITGME